MLRRVFDVPLVVLVLALPGCGSCQRSPVPFGLDAGHPAASATQAGSPGSPHGDPAPDRLTLETRELPEGTLRVVAAGGEIELGGEPIRAFAEGDLDGDGDRDVIAVGSGTAANGPRVVVALREGVALGAWRELATMPPLDPGCTVEHASIRVLGASRLAARADVACPADEQGAVRVLHAFAISARGPVRLLERFVLDARARGDRVERMELRAEDRDRDGHEDLLVDVELFAEGTEAAADLTLTWFDRPAGLARDSSEPEARIAALADAARSALRRRPEQARGMAARAVALWEALCREGGRPRLELGGQAGIQCGRSSGAARAYAVLAQASARTGNVLAAIAAAEALDSGALLVREVERAAVRAALERIASATSPIAEGPVAHAPSDRSPRLSALAFLDEERVLIRGPEPRVVRLPGGAEEPADPEEVSLALADPSRRHRVLEIERRCEGTVLVIAPVDPTADLPGARSSALLAARRAPRGLPCPDLTAEVRADDDGWRVLGWAPQGVLAARSTELRLVPLDVEGRAVGVPRIIEPKEAAPAPIAPGHATRDVRYWAYANGWGLVLIDLGPARAIRFLRPQGWSPAEGSAIDVAVSPSGRRIAWVAGGRVRWVELLEAGQNPGR